MFYSKLNNAFYAPQLRSDYDKSGTWPVDAVEVPDEVYAEFSQNPPAGKHRSAGPDGLPEWEDNAPPTNEQVIAQLTIDVQKHLDEAAQALGYDDIKSAVTYAEEPAVPKFQAEGQAFRAWRSLVWDACYAIMGDVLAGNRPIPTAEELIAELPLLELP